MTVDEKDLLWGSLRGVRPTKAVHYLIDQGFNEEAIKKRMFVKHGVSVLKTALLIEIAYRQRKKDGFILKEHLGKTNLVSVYIAIPFCPSRCNYCSFIFRERKQNEKLFSDFLTSLFFDLEKTEELIRKKGFKVQSLYIGGGTPTILSAEELGVLFSKLKKSSAFSYDKIEEITVEAGRADSISNEKIKIFKQNNVHRLTINPQTMKEETLKRIGRNHTVEKFETVFYLLKEKASFVLNADLIAGLPGESLEDFEHTLKQILVMMPQNVTIHNLAIKQGAILKSTSLCKENFSDEKLFKSKGKEILKMLELAYNMLTRVGYKPYYLYRQKYTVGHEANIGYALPGFECLYNIQVMEERQNIIGVGAGAMSKVILPYKEKEVKIFFKDFYFPKDVLMYIKNIEQNCAKRNMLFE